VALDDKFCEAWINSEHRVLGRNLRPYCLWHQLVLQVIESPLLQGAGDLLDLDVASHVCSTRYGEVLDLAPRHPLSIALKMRWGGFRVEQEAFSDYLEDYVQVPDFRIIEDGPTGPPLVIGHPPYVLAIVAKLIHWTGWPERTVWELEFGKAHWYSAMASKCEGAKVDFKTQDSNKFLEELKAKYGKRPR
jgi:hypothetical protein